MIVIRVCKAVTIELAQLHITNLELPNIWMIGIFYRGEGAFYMTGDHDIDKGWVGDVTRNSSTQICK